MTLYGIDFIPTKSRKKKPPTLEKAARTFAREWANWHEDGSDIFPHPELVDAGHGILEALGLSMVETKTGKQRLKKVKP